MNRQRFAGSSIPWMEQPILRTDFLSSVFRSLSKRNGVTVLGVVYDPLRDEMFYAESGAGAYLNGRKLCVSSTDDLSRALLATGFPYDIRVSQDNNLDFFSAMAVRAQAIRRPGAAALDLAYLAAGRLDGFWELKLKPWDTAAGCLLVGRSRRKTFRPRGRTMESVLTRPGRKQWTNS